MTSFDTNEEQLHKANWPQLFFASVVRFGFWGAWFLLGFGFSVQLLCFGGLLSWSPWMFFIRHFYRLRVVWLVSSFDLFCGKFQVLVVEMFVLECFLVSRHLF